MPEDQPLEGQLLSQEVERRLCDQLDEVENIDVDLQTDLLKILQGRADTIYVAGQGLVIKGIRVQDIKLQTDNVAINPFSALFGQIQLHQPVDVTTRIVLTEVDLNRALTSEIVYQKLQQFNLKVDDELVSLKLEEMQLHLPEKNQMAFTGKVLIQEKEQTYSIGFTSMLRPRTRQSPIILESFQCTQGNGISLDIIAALIQKAKELVNLPYFEFDDIILRIKEIEVQKGNLILLVEAQVKQISSQ
jgi:hypothetical protein